MHCILILDTLGFCLQDDEQMGDHLDNHKNHTLMVDVKPVPVPMFGDDYSLAKVEPLFSRTSIL